MRTSARAGVTRRHPGTGTGARARPAANAHCARTSARHDAGVASRGAATNGALDACTRRGSPRDDAVRAARSHA